MSSNDEPTTEDEESLTNEIRWTKREFLAALGVGGAAAIGYVAASNDDIPEANLQTGGLSSPLTQQYRRGHYVTSSAAAFDASELDTGEFVWVSDGTFGVIDEDNNVGSHPIGSADNPIPSATIEEVGIGTDENADGDFELTNVETGSTFLFGNDGSFGADTVTLGEIGAKVSMTVNRTIDHDIETIVGWNVVAFEDEGYSTFDQTGSITVEEPGTYFIATDVVWNSDANWSAGDRIQTKLLVDNQDLFTIREEVVAGNNLMTQSASTVKKLAGGEALQVEVLQQSGETISVRGLDEEWTQFSVVRLG